MLIPGLVSITFRSLAPDEIVRLAVESGLQSIEWGGDVHVPPGETERARAVGRQTRAAGLMVSAYGSYYRLGETARESASFDRVLDCAAALGAPTVRVWAGRQGSAMCPAPERGEIIDDALRVAEIAGRAGITVSLEYHEGTLTDTRASVRSLLNELPHPNIEFLWQPPHGEPVEACAESLLEILPRLRNVHVFHWWPSARERLPLADGEARWSTYVDIVRESGRTVDFLLEFMAGDSPSQLPEDAATLRRLLGQDSLL